MPVLAALFGIVVYTPEYNGTSENDPSGWKTLFSEIKVIKMSVLMQVLIILGLILLFAFLIKFFTGKIINIYSDLETKNKEISQRDLKLANITKEVLSSDSRKKIKDTMEVLMLNYSEVISIQLYEYIENKRDKKVEYEIKPTHYYYTRYGQVANLIHEKYEISKRLIEEYRNVKSKYDGGNNESIGKYIKKYTEQLISKGKNKNRITEDSLNKYSLLTLATQYYLNDVSYKNESLDEVFINELESQKRTGFLRGILHNEYYKFMHSGNSYKGSRIYITKCLPIENKNHMFIIILNSDDIPNENPGDYLDNMGKRFYELLLENTSLVYNNIK